jgi:DNA polymerase III epsilon subunit-like protein
MANNRGSKSKGCMALFVWMLVLSLSANTCNTHGLFNGMLTFGLLTTTVIGIYLWFSKQSRSEYHYVNPPKSLVLKKSEGEQPEFIVIDVETTGLLTDSGKPTKTLVLNNPDWYPAIVQIAWLRLDNNYSIVDHSAYYIKQNNPIPHEATSIHGITNERCEKEGVHLGFALEELRNALAEVPCILGHNVQFDRYVIEAESIRYDLPRLYIGKQFYDTMKMGVKLMGRKYFKLEAIAKTVGVLDIRNLHNAEQDVKVTASVFMHLHSNGYRY